MKALVVYESMFGNTRDVANRVAAGLDPTFDVTVAHVSDVTSEMADMAEFLVVGGPTHVHGMASARTRDAAKKMAEKEGSRLELEPHAADRDCASGSQRWTSVTVSRRQCSTHGRMDPDSSPDSASRGIARRLRRARCALVATESFLMAKGGLRVGCRRSVRAECWAAGLGRRLGVVSSSR